MCFLKSPLTFCENCTKQRVGVSGMGQRRENGKLFQRNVGAGVATVPEMLYI